MSTTAKPASIPVITVDGPAGVGKGTLTKRLAAIYGFHYLDSGAVYRALASQVLARSLVPEQLDEIVLLATQLALSFPPEHDYQTMLGNNIIEADIRTETCSAMASKIAAQQPIREQLLALQKSFQRAPGLVCDGRDMGTVVFPQAQVKIFLDASCQERAQRRYKQLIDQGISANFAHLFDSISARDQLDRTRAHSPLVAAEGAWVIDSTEMTIEEVIGAATDYIKRSL